MARLQFVVPVFRRSPHLKETLTSLLTQDIPDTRVALRVVGWPSIRNELAVPDGISVHLVPESHENEEGIASDWERAINVADRPVVTLAHSDDIYVPSYSRAILDAFTRFPTAGIAYTANSYLTYSARLKLLLLIKRLINPGRLATRPVLITPQRMLRALKYGSFIPCPTVAYNVPVIRDAIGGGRIFNTHLKIALDWDAWVTLAEAGVHFVYIPQPLVAIRVHAHAATQEGIRNGQRKAEELAVLQRLWGPAKASLLARAIGVAQMLHKVAS